MDSSSGIEVRVLRTVPTVRSRRYTHPFVYISKYFELPGMFRYQSRAVLSGFDAIVFRQLSQCVGSGYDLVVTLAFVAWPWPRIVFAR